MKIKKANGKGQLVATAAEIRQLIKKNPSLSKVLAPALKKAQGGPTGDMSGFLDELEQAYSRHMGGVMPDSLRESISDAVSQPAQPSSSAGLSDPTSPSSAAPVSPESGLGDMASGGMDDSLPPDLNGIDDLGEPNEANNFGLGGMEEPSLDGIEEPEDIDLSGGQPLDTNPVDSDANEESALRDQQARGWRTEDEQKMDKSWGDEREESALRDRQARGGRTEDEQKMDKLMGDDMSEFDDDQMNRQSKSKGKLTSIGGQRGFTDNLAKIMSNVLVEVPHPQGDGVFCSQKL